MPSSGTWRRVGLVRTDVSETRVAFFFRVQKIRREKGVSRLLTARECLVSAEGVVLSNQRDVTRCERMFTLFYSCCAESTAVVCATSSRGRNAVL
jgi:hypothetical protein